MGLKTTTTKPKAPAAIPVDRPASDDTPIGPSTQGIIPKENLMNIVAKKDTLSLKLEGVLSPGLRTPSRLQTEGRQVQLTMQARRTLCRRVLTHRRLFQEQVSRGRPDLRVTWCGDQSCLIDNLIFKNPSGYTIDKHQSQSDYEKFAITMVDGLFPELSTTSAKIRKRQAIMSFVVSPPIKAALGKFLMSCKNREFQPLDDDVQTELVNIWPVFHDLMFGEKTLAKVKTAHLYIRPGTTETDTMWTLRDFILQFLVTAEIWRSYKTCRSVEWSMGSSKAVADFMTNMLLQYWLMYTEGCLDARESLKEQQLDKFWNDWLENYPVIGGQDEDGSGEAFVIRDEVEGTEETVLEAVGYLGGLGSCDESYKPARKNQAGSGGG